MHRARLVATVHDVTDLEGPTEPGSGIFGSRVPPTEAALVLIPVPFDATASYLRRSRFGPEAILRASHQVDLFDLETGTPFAAGIAMLPINPEVERWNAEASRAVDRARTSKADERDAATAEVNRVCELVNRDVYEEARAWLAQGKIVGLIGGDHATPYGNIRAHLERYPNAGILHIDAHADLRDAYEGFTWSHASIMHNVVTRLAVPKLVQVGLRDVAESEIAKARDSNGRIEVVHDYAIAEHRFSGQPFKKQVDTIIGKLPQDVYVSFDIDGLDPALCPSTGTPVPGGLSFHEANALLAAIRGSGRRLIGFDLNEVAASPDPTDEWDGNVGARLAYKLCGHALQGTSKGHLRRV